MKKVIFGSLIAAASVWGVYTSNQTEGQVALSDLQIENVEAYGGLFEAISNWWNRPDYSCDPGVCYRYYPGGPGVRGEWEYLGSLPHMGKHKGNGEFAHAKNCECENQGGVPNLN